MEKIGIENLKNVVTFSVNLGVEISKKLSDGKITFWEGLSLIPELKDLPGIISKASDIKAEFMGLDDSERDELLAFVKSEFDLTNNDAEVIIERSIETVTNIAMLVRDIQTIGTGGGLPIPG